MSLLNPPKADKPVRRPETLGEAKEIISASFRYQHWNYEEQKRYFALIGVDGANTSRDVRRIIEDMENTGMILFEKEKKGE